MFDLNEEQVEEIEVLESIFADSFTRKTTHHNNTHISYDYTCTFL